MRQFVVDELNQAEMERLEQFLQQRCESAGLDGAYWLRLPEELLTTHQKEHKDCQPLYTSVELGRQFVRFEMLARSRNKMRCSCIGFVTPEQRAFVLKFIDDLLLDADIKA